MNQSPSREVSLDKIDHEMIGISNRYVSLRKSWNKFETNTKSSMRKSKFKAKRNNSGEIRFNTRLFYN